MRCRAARERIPGYLSSALPLGEAQRLTAHLEACASCRAEAAAFRRAEEALRQLAVVEVAPEPSPDLCWPAPALAGRRQMREWAGAALVMAAAIAALLICLHLRAPGPGPVKYRTEAAAPPAAPESAFPIARPQAQAQARPRSYTSPRRTRHGVGPAPSLSTKAVPEQPRPEPTPVSQPVQESDDRPGLILVLGRPEPVVPRSEYDVEVVFPDGARSLTQRAVERDASGQPKAILIVCSEIAPESLAPEQGDLR